jgi:hypothetical protein
LNPSIYNSSGSNTSAQPPVFSLRHRDRPSRVQPREEEDPRTRPKTIPRLTAEEVKTLQELLAEERRRYDQSYENELRSQVEHDLTYPEFGSLVPKPLVVRAKNTPNHISIQSQQGNLRNGGDSLE